MKEHLTIIKVGGKIVENSESLNALLKDFAAVEGKKLLVHGGGRSATQMAARLGVETKMVDGRRITDEAMLEVVTMVYGGLVNKNLVARLQALGVNAVGLTGADLNLIMSVKRPVQPINFGYVGDIKYVNAKALENLLESGAVPVLAPLTHDKEGSMLNTNADTIASSVAQTLASVYDVTLTYCSSTPGVMKDLNDPSSVIPTITSSDFALMVADGTISEGMIPKLQNAFEAINSGVSRVVITSASALNAGTTIMADPETDD